MFSISCFERSTCLANVVIGTVVTFKFVNTCVSLTRFLQSEMKIIHIIVQDQVGQNNIIVLCVVNNMLIKCFRKK